MSGFIAGEKILKYDNGNVKKYLEELVGKEIKFEKRKFSFSIGSYNLLLVKSRDVPRILDKYPGKTLLGITGKDWFEEYLLEKGNSKLEVLKEFPESAQARVCALTKKDFELENYKNSVLKIVTPYFNLSKEWAEEKEIEGYVIENVIGETEGWVSGEFAEVAIDTVASETTAKANNLKIFEEILRSYTIFISNKNNLSQAKRFLGEK